MLLGSNKYDNWMRNLKMPISPGAGLREKTPPEYWMKDGSEPLEIKTGSCLIVRKHGWGSDWEGIGLPFKNVTLTKELYRQG